MKAVQRVVALIMLGLWVPAMSLCLTERAGLLSNEDCCPASANSRGAPAGHHSNTAPCCQLASATYKSNDDLQVAVFSEDTSRVPAPAPYTSADHSELDRLAIGPKLANRTVSPDLLVRWQFLFRAALNPRAPCFASR